MKKEDFEKMRRIRMYEYFKRTRDIRLTAKVCGISDEELKECLDSKEYKLLEQREQNLMLIFLYLKAHHPEHAKRICNVLGRHLKFRIDSVFTKEDFKELIYGGKVTIRGLGEKSKECLRGYFYD